MSVETTDTARQKRVGKLATISDLIRETRRIYREGRIGNLDTLEMTRLASLLKMMVDMLERSELLKRVEALENVDKTQNISS